MPAGCALSLLRQSRLAQGVERGLQNRFAPDQPFDAELGIEAASFREGGLRLIYIAFQRVGGGEIQVGIPITPTGVDRLVGFVDRRVEMAEAEFSVGQPVVKLAYTRIARTQPHRLPQIGLGLFEVEQSFGCASCRQETGIIWIDGKAGVGDGDRVFRALRLKQVVVARFN